ncbi:MAG: tRNA lysidine(34) synthetase TilS [Vicinamibacterales bacterium]
MAAVSGGSDSVAQLILLRDLAADGLFELAGAAHLNHQMRPSADRDEAHVRDLCATLGVPVVVDRAPVLDLAAAWRCSPEVAARRARYAFLEGARTRLAADRVAVAHTCDDQAETLLLRLFRGAGTHGLRGIPAVRGAIIRPVLECSHAELRSHLVARRVAWVDDETNRDTSQARNRVRHELLPTIRARYQPAIVRVLARTADIAADEDRLLEDLAAEVESRAVRVTPHGVSLAGDVLASAPLALRRRVVRRAMATAGAVRAPDLADVERVLAVVSGTLGVTETAGLRVERFSGDAVLSIRGVAVEPPLPDRVLVVPGHVELPELGAGCRLVAERPINGKGRAAGRHRVVLRGDVPAPLMVRARRPGDRIRPVGLGGSKKLQDLLVDRKVPRQERARVPVVADATGRLVWVVGHATASAAVAAAGASDVIILTFDQPDASEVPGSEGP